MAFDGLGPRPRNGLSLCAGAGGLDLGLQLAEPGFETRCYVESDEYPVDQLVAAQRAGYMAPAPIWDDVKTFDGRPWRGLIDTILAGYPCQPFSAAGKRLGEDDERHLWPDVARIIREVGPRWVFLENVAGHISLGLETVLRELREMGFDVAAQPFSAAEVGAPHERLRIFVVAYNKDNCRRLYEGRRGQGKGEFDPAGASGARAVVDSAGGGWRARGDASLARRSGHPDRASEALGDTIGRSGELRREPGDVRSEGAGAQISWTFSTGRKFGPAGTDFSDSKGADWWREFAQERTRSGRPGPARIRPGSALANGIRAGLEEHAGDGDRGHEPGRIDAAEAGPTCARGTYLFPPAPGDAAAWADLIQAAPDLAPALSRRGIIYASAIHLAALLDTNAPDPGELGSGSVAEAGQLSEVAEEAAEILAWASAESSVCRASYGMAARTRALKLLGNGVCPLAASNAFRNLARDLGLAPLDLGTFIRSGQLRAA